MLSAENREPQPDVTGFYLVHDTTPISLHDKPKNKGPAYELRNNDFEILYAANLKLQANRLEQRIELNARKGGDQFVLTPKRKLLNLSYVINRLNGGTDIPVAVLTRKKGNVQLLDLEKNVLASTVSMNPERKFSDYVVDVLDQDFSKDPQHQYQIVANGRVVGQGEREYVPKPENEVVVHKTKYKLFNKVLNKLTSRNYSTVYIELSKDFEIEPPLLMAFAIAHHYFCVVNVHDTTSS